MTPTWPPLPLPLPLPAAPSPVPMLPLPLPTQGYPPRVIDSVRQAVSRLDPDQRRASDAIRNADARYNLQVAATAGSGKTTMLTTTLAAALVLDNVDPKEILLATFTDKAGQEMRSRLGKLLGGPVPRDMQVGTFHAIGLRRLRAVESDRWQMDQNIDRARFDSHIPTSDDVWTSILGWRREGVYGTGEASLGLEGEIDPRGYALAVDKLRGQGHRPDSPGAAAAAAELGDRVWVAWAMYERAKVALGVWDFADVLDVWLDWLRDGRDVWRPRLVAVDEAQDNNRVQLEIAAALAGVTLGGR